MWKVGIDRVEAVHEATRGFPKEELYVLVSQMRRAATSVPSTRAEGQRRSNARDFLSFLSSARGPLRESETQRTIAVRLGYPGREAALPLWDRLQRVARMRAKLIAAFLAAPQRRTPHAERRTEFA